MTKNTSKKPPANEANQKPPLEGFSAKATWAIVAGIAVVIALVIDVSDGDTLGSTEAIGLCISDYREGAKYGSDVSLLSSQATENEYHFIVNVSGTLKNIYGTDVKTSMSCQVDKATKLVTSSRYFQ